ncbi:MULTISPECIES: lysozyme inhibitor LprI family protein [unclassified Pantoea]|uniref:lysozyme inhibitor LprI family protein n=1 Tax=unclassified Pantoea TaxID=2630326 RepID=UPI001E4C52AB|nr:MULTISPECIES: lysozyme inhibitor LprI family protein [unclassified Pantoea]
MRFSKLYVFTFLLVMNKSAFATALCSSEPSDSAVYQCTLHEKQLAEDALNREYTAAKKRIVSSYRADKKLADDYLSTLTNTQRGWLKYRDGQCKLEAFDAEEGSIAHEVATNICIVRINKKRLELLRQIPY